MTAPIADVQPGRDRVLAQPTKEFFVEMLTRDIALIPAIVDLVDNSVDGARRHTEGERYDGLYVRLATTDSMFRVEDNCGGLEIEVARLYAFRFGRDKSRPVDAHTIGQFGVGMKRTLFKLGNRLAIKSRAPRSSFSLDVNVREWLMRPEWDFQLEAWSETDSRTLEETGVTIEVSDMHTDVAADLALPTWQAELAAEVRNKHRVAIAQGLEITVNGHKLEVPPLTLLDGEGVSPGRFERTYPVRGSEVTLLIMCGIGPYEEADAGWYVFCNGRLIIGPDTTSATVWGVMVGTRNPRFHAQYARFRGYAYFDSDDPASLPWTTTKTAMDGDSPIWRDCRNHMGLLTRQVINFLNELDRQTDAARASDNLDRDDLVVNALKRASVVEARAAQGSARFISPRVDLSEAPLPEGRISYTRSVEEIKRAKALLRVTANRDVGNATFEYFLDAEGND